MGTQRPDGKLHLQLQVGGPSASSDPWSRVVSVDMLGGASLVLATLQGEGVDDNGCTGYQLLVTAAPVAGGEGAVALHVLPHCVVYNATSEPLQVGPAGCVCVWWQGNSSSVTNPLSPQELRVVFLCEMVCGAPSYLCSAQTGMGCCTNAIQIRVQCR